jgi:hypothetical protein
MACSNGWEEGNYRAASPRHSPLAPPSDARGNAVRQRLLRRRDEARTLPRMKRRTLLQAGASAVMLAAQAPASAARKASAADEERRARLYALMGRLPPRDRKVSAQLVSTEDRGSYLLDKLVLDLNGQEPVPAYFARPRKRTGRLPTVLFNHSHGGGYTIGKREFIDGREYLARPGYAEFLTSLGCNALCIDAWIFGERSGRVELDMFKEMIWNGRVLWGMMVYDSLKAVDYLATRDDVDVSRLATLGMSMGSSSAQWVAALDTRIKVTVDICCLTDWHTLVEAGGLKGHGIYYYVPDLLNHFTAAQMNALIAPRAHLALEGSRDALTPLAGLEKIDAELKKVYAAAGQPGNWKLFLNDGGHLETPAMREEIRSWLVERL